MSVKMHAFAMPIDSFVTRWIHAAGNLWWQRLRDAKVVSVEEYPVGVTTDLFEKTNGVGLVIQNATRPDDVVMRRVLSQEFLNVAVKEFRLEVEEFFHNETFQICGLASLDGDHRGGTSWFDQCSLISLKWT